MYERGKSTCVFTLGVKMARLFIAVAANSTGCIYSVHKSGSISIFSRVVSDTTFMDKATIFPSSLVFFMK